MMMKNQKQEAGSPLASQQDVQRLLGDLDATIVSVIMTLAPSTAEIEEVALWISGEGEALPERHQPASKVKAILDLVVMDEDEERYER